MMEKIKFIHYNKNLIEKLEPRKYDQNENKYHAKPNGLWLSVEGFEAPDNLNWKQWCESENFHVENLKFAHEIKLKKDANILHLKTADEIFEFTKKYPFITVDKISFNGFRDQDTYQLDWYKVKTLYQGIIISPYNWFCRMSIESCWYYGWDCSSGCIWDLECIDEFKEKL